MLLDYNGESQRKISYDVYHRGSRNYRDNSNSFCTAEPEGIDTADDKVYDIDEIGSKQDLRFHEGLCQPGISTDVLDTLQGCDTPIISAPGSSDLVRQDE